MTAYSLLFSPDPLGDERCLHLARRLRGVILSEVGAGEPVAVIRYVRAWRGARSTLLAQLTAAGPHLALPYLVSEALDHEAAAALFTPWRWERSDESEALTLHLIAALRHRLGRQAAPLVPSMRATRAAADEDFEGLTRGYRQTLATLRGRSRIAAQILDAFGLSQSELEAMFGVTRQAAGLWLAGEMPAGRLRKAAIVLDVADVLGHALDPGRLPLEARRPIAAYDGLDMLTMIAHDRHAELLEHALSRSAHGGAIVRDRASSRR